MSLSRFIIIIVVLPSPSSLPQWLEIRRGTRCCFYVLRFTFYVLRFFV